MSGDNMEVNVIFRIGIVLCIVLYANAQEISKKPNANLKTSIDRDLTAIMKLEQQDADAAKINDIDTLVSLWTEDSVLILPGAEPIAGIQAIRELLEREKQQSASIPIKTYSENWKERRIFGDEAYEWGEIEVTSLLPNGNQVLQTAYAVRVLQRNPDGSWKISRSIITPGPRKS